MIAVNDGILLWNHINRIIRNHFRDQPYYAEVLDLFNEVDGSWLLFCLFKASTWTEIILLSFFTYFYEFAFTGRVPDSLWRNDWSDNYSRGGERSVQIYFRTVSDNLFDISNVLPKLCIDTFLYCDSVNILLLESSEVTFVSYQSKM